MTRIIRFPDESRMMPHQAEVLWQDAHRFKTLIWHRRARKTTTAINEVVKQAFLTKGVYWHLFPTYAEAKNAIWRDPKMLFGIIPPEIIKKRNESELVIEFVNGSIYQLIGADNPDRLRGAGPMGCVFDEYDLMKDDVWPIVEPILRQNGGWAWFVGTPKGKGKLYDLYNRGNDPVFQKEWKSWLLKASTSGIISPEDLEQSRLSMPATLYNQEWECEFLEGEGSVFRNVRDIATAIPFRPVDGHYYVMGVDLAKVQDYTVITVYDRETNAQVYQDRFQTLEWPFQKKRIKSISDMYNRAIVRLDATGLGDPIADDLARSGVPIEPFKLTNETKKEIIEKLSIYIEQKRIRILPITDTLLEFDNFSYEIGPSGRVFYQAREGYHDDIVISHALAVWDLQPLIIKPKIEDMTSVQQSYLEATGRLKKDNYLEDVEEE